MNNSYFHDFDSVEITTFPGHEILNVHTIIFPFAGNSVRTEYYRPSENIFLSLSAIPGGGYKDVRVVYNSGVSNIERHVHGQIQLRGAFGYDRKSFFAGLVFSTTIRNMDYKNYQLDLATEQFRLLVGWRLDVTKNR